MWPNPSFVALIKHGLLVALSQKLHPYTFRKAFKRSLWVVMWIVQGSVWRVISATSRLTLQGGSHRSYLDGRQWTPPTASIKAQHDWTFSAHVRLPPIKSDCKCLPLLKASSQRSHQSIRISIKTIRQTKPQSTYVWAVSLQRGQETRLKVVEFKWVLTFQCF